VQSCAVAQRFPDLINFLARICAPNFQMSQKPAELRDTTQRMWWNCGTGSQRRSRR
jgi:hypothetical protein